MVCCSDSEYEEEVMTREDDKAEEEITDGEVQEDSPGFSNKYEVQNVMTMTQQVPHIAYHSR